MSFFTQLAALCAQTESVTISASMSGDRLRLLLLPKPKAGGGDVPALSQPARFDGLPAELDASFPEAFQAYLNARSDLVAACEDTAALIKAAADAKRAEGVKAIQGAGKTPTKGKASAAAVTTEGDDDDDSDESPPAGVTGAPAATPAPATAGGADLLDGLGL